MTDWLTRPSSRYASCFLKFVVSARIYCKRLLEKMALAPLFFFHGREPWAGTESPSANLLLMHHSWPCISIFDLYRRFGWGSTWRLIARGVSQSKEKIFLNHQDDTRSRIDVCALMTPRPRVDGYSRSHEECVIVIQFKPNKRNEKQHTRKCSYLSSILFRSLTSSRKRLTQSVPSL